MSGSELDADWLVATVAACRADAQRDRDRAWQDLLARLLPHALRIARREQRKIWWFQPSREVAEDAAMEALTSLYRHIDSITDPTGMMAWLVKTIQNKLHDMARKPYVRNVILTEEQDAFDSVIFADDMPVSGELLEAIHCLSPLKRQVVEEMYWGGLKVSEIAMKYGIPEGTIKSRLWSAYQDLRESLRRMGVAL